MAITTNIPQAHNRAVRQASELPEEQNPERIPKESRTTDRDGNITQYTAYLPYGELLVDEHSSSEDLPYKFNGKELDEETGLYYYGARYMQPITSVWYGIDPLTEKYPDVSAYAYCMGNPVRLVDVDGRFITIVDDGIVMYNYNMEKNAFINSKGEVYNPTNEFVNNVMEAIQTICEGDFGRQFISELVNNENGVEIVDNTENYYRVPELRAPNYECAYSGPLDASIISSVAFVPGAPSVSGGTSYTSLGHELQHSLDRINGTKDERTWQTTTTGIDNKLVRIEYSEISAVHTENRIRSEHNLPIRTHYIVDQEGRGTGTPLVHRSKSQNGSSIEYFSNYYYNDGSHNPNYKRIHKDRYEDRYKY